MSKTFVSVERVVEVRPHPNADRLDIIRVLGYDVVTQKGNFEVGDFVVYFPPDILIPPDVVEEKGVKPYLKHAIYPGDTEKTQCRVSSARIRLVPSHGFCVPIKTTGPSRVPAVATGTDVSVLYGAKKYVAPIRLGAGDEAPPLERFHSYTDIENIERYPDVFKDGDNVVVTEKIHGTNCRMGLVRDNNDEFVFCAGSHKIRRVQSEKSLYWHFMTQDVMNLLSALADSRDCCSEPCHDVVLFGEIFGPGVQDLDYGQTEKAFRVFDIAVDGQYMNYWDVVDTCDRFDLLAVPQLYVGNYSQDLVSEWTYGDTQYDGVKSKFKGREGCVIKPMVEGWSGILMGRRIVKSVSADYRARKGGKDIGE